MTSRAAGRPGSLGETATNNVVELDPPARAMVWESVGQPHRALEVGSVTLRAGEALAEIELATICSSDVLVATGQRPALAPVVLGHEQVGRIVATGERARRADGTRLHVGDRVVWSVTASCGECDRCRQGIAQRCRRRAEFGREPMTEAWALTGAFASHAHLPAGTSIVKVDDTIPAEVLAPLSCGTASAWAAVDAARNGRDPRSTSLLVFGAGLLGLTAAAIGKSSGMRVVVSDPDPARRALALQFGAVDTADPSSERSLGSFAAVIETSGSAGAVSAAIGSLAVGGVAVLSGTALPSQPIPFDLDHLVRRLITVRGLHHHGPLDLLRAATWMGTHHLRFPFARLVGASFGLADLDEGFLLAGTAQHIRVGVDPRAIRPYAHPTAARTAAR